MKEHKISNDITVREFRRHPGYFNVDSKASIAIGHVAMTRAEIKALYELVFQQKEVTCDECAYYQDANELFWNIEQGIFICVSGPELIERRSKRACSIFKPK